MLGLCGSHRSGKSTLAREFAQRNDILFVETTVSQVFRDLGLDPSKTYEVDDRLMIQELILQTLTRQYREARKKSTLFIADRTPLDFAAYTLADITGNACPTESVARLVNDYVQRCIDATMEHFSMVVLVQPGIPVVEAPGKARSCPAYMEHFNTLARGLLADERVGCQRFVIPKTTLDLEARLEALDKCCGIALVAAEAIKKSSLLH